MRHGRAKAARKTLQYFNRTIGLRAPYWVLLDATFVVGMFQQKILPFRERLDRILQTTGADGPNHYCITQAAVDELQNIHDSLQAKQHEKTDTFRQALDWIYKECLVLNREKEETASTKEAEAGNEEGENANTQDKKSNKNSSSTPAQDDLLHHIQNNDGDKPCIVASQDEDLLNYFRMMGTVPIVRLANACVLILEQPSKQSQKQFQGVERKKWKHSLPEAERALVQLVKKEDRAAAVTKGISSDGAALPPRQQQRHSKQKAKGPNPLSCKRKQGSGDGANKETASQRRRSRAKKQKTES
jgi:rRNA-processing protein FCF1